MAQQFVKLYIDELKNDSKVLEVKAFLKHGYALCTLASKQGVKNSLCESLLESSLITGYAFKFVDIFRDLSFVITANTQYPLYIDSTNSAPFILVDNVTALATLDRVILEKSVVINKTYLNSKLYDYMRAFFSDLLGKPSTASNVIESQIQEFINLASKSTNTEVSDGMPTTAIVNKGDSSANFENLGGSSRGMSNTACSQTEQTTQNTEAMPTTAGVRTSNTYSIEHEKRMQRLSALANLKQQVINLDLKSCQERISNLQTCVNYFTDSLGLPLDPNSCALEGCNFTVSLDYSDTSKKYVVMVLDNNLKTSYTLSAFLESNLLASNVTRSKLSYDNLKSAHDVWEIFCVLEKKLYKYIDDKTASQINLLTK